MFTSEKDEYTLYNDTMDCIQRTNKTYECLGKNHANMKHDNSSNWIKGLNLIDGWFYKRVSRFSFTEGANSLNYQSIFHNLNDTRVYILDRNEFLMCKNAFKSISIKDHNKGIFMRVKRVIKMESKGCNNYINYSYTECIIAYINRVGIGFQDFLYSTLIILLCRWQVVGLC